VNLSVDEIKRAYSWFHSSFPDYKTNEWCLQDDIALRNKMERWLVETGE